MNANIVKMQIFHKYDLRGHSRSLIQRRHLPCFNLNLRSYGHLFVLDFISISKLLLTIKDFMVVLFKCVGSKFSIPKCFDIY